MRLPQVRAWKVLRSTSGEQGGLLAEASRNHSPTCVPTHLRICAHAEHHPQAAASDPGLGSTYVEMRVHMYTDIASPGCMLADYS